MHEFVYKCEQDRLSIEKLSKSIVSLEKDLVGYKSMAQDSNVIMGNLIEHAGVGSVHLESCTAEALIDYGWYKILPVNLTVSSSVRRLLVI